MRKLGGKVCNGFWALYSALMPESPVQYGQMHGIAKTTVSLIYHKMHANVNFLNI